MTALFARLNLTTVFLPIDASGYCKRTSEAVSTHPYPFDVQIHNDAMFQLWKSFNVQYGPFPNRWKPFMVCFLTSRKMQMVEYNLIANWGPLSVNEYQGIPYFMTKLFKNIVAFCFKLILVMVVACFNWESLSVKISTVYFWFVVPVAVQNINDHELRRPYSWKEMKLSFVCHLKYILRAWATFLYKFVYIIRHVQQGKVF